MAETRMLAWRPTSWSRSCQSRSKPGILRGSAARELLEVHVDGAEPVVEEHRELGVGVVRQAKFPFLRTIEEFDFTYQSGLRKELLGSYLGPELVVEGRSPVNYGAPERERPTLQWRSPTERSRMGRMRGS